MTHKQKVAIFAPLILVVSMYPIFHLFATAFGERLGWYFGLILYWLVWGAAFSVWMIGKENILRLIRPQKINIKIFLLVIFPSIIASLHKLVPGMEYQKPSLLIILLLISTAFGNGFFEEVLWRGVYLSLFPNNVWFWMLWPSFWFAIWHYAPGSVSPSSNVVALMVGAGAFGFYLSFLAKKMGTIWWSIMAHTLAGMVMIL